MNRENASFLLGGIFLGFMLGFSIAYAVYRGEPSGGGIAGVSMQAPSNPSDPSGAGAVAQASPPPAMGNGGGEASEQTMQRVQQELVALREALKANPKDSQTLTRLADLYYDAGMFDKARDYYARSLEADPKNPNVSTDLGICFRRLGDSDRAIQQFRKSIAIDSRHWQSWLNLGIVSLFDKSDVKTAEESFAKVKELNPAFEGLPQLQQALDQARSGGKP